MRNSTMIVAALCSLAASFLPRPALAIPADAGASAAVDTFEQASGVCGNTDEFFGARIEGVEKPAVVREFLITDEMKARADITGDGIIDVDDLVMLLAAWGNCPVWSELTCQGDINGDNVVEYSDLNIMLTLLNTAVNAEIELPVESAEIVIQAGELSKAKSE